MGLIRRFVVLSSGFCLIFTLTIWLLTSGPMLAEDLDDFANCPDNWIDCGNGRCVYNGWRCDNSDDCGNMKDEEDCHLPPEVKCLSSQFRCVEDHNCIPNSWYCDGEHDCKDGSDEKQCNDSTTENCGFRCRNEHCVPIRWRCDGGRDCPDGSDEENCTQGQACPESDFTCHSGVCLNKSLVCDGKKDCPGGEDEGSHCGDACDNSTCQQKCRATPNGAECYCNPGHELQKDGRTCHDINECSQEGFCSHRCTNTVGGYSCSCLDGYFLEDNRTCLAKGPEPLLVFATTQEIRGILLRTQKYFLIHQAMFSATALDVDPKDSRLYWSETSPQGSAVYSCHLDGSGLQTVINNGLLVPEDVAVDWLGRNLYITDSGLKQVLVCKIDGSFCSVLHEDNVDKPRSIKLDPSEGLMYWTDWGKNPGILRSGMDGTGRTTLVSTGIEWPNGIAIDHTTNRLYWCDAKTSRIEYVTLDGKTRKVVLEEKMFHPYSLAVFEDTVYWADWKKFSVDSCSKFNGRNQKIIARENGKNINAVHVYHPVLEKRVSNPCWSTLCSHTCVLSPFGKQRCICPPGFYLASDKITCKIDAKSRQILLSDGGSLLHVQPQATGNRAVTTILNNSAVAIGDVTYDRQHNTIIFSDIVKNSIMSLNVSSMEKRDLIKNHIQSAVGLDYDWMGNNVYWTDLGKGTIEVFALRTAERIVLVSGLSGPLALALLPEKGLMFVSVITGENPHISMFNMDGTDEKILQSATGLPLSLAVDPMETRIYYIDSRNGIIASVDYLDHKQPKIVHKYVDHAVSVAVSEKFIYWTTTKSDFLYRMHRNSSEPATLRLSLESNNKTDMRKIKFFRPFNTDVENRCSSRSGMCSHICLVNPSGHTCACPVSFELGPDHRTCKAVKECSKTEVPCAKVSACIPQSWVCDGTPDCSDGSDEENCAVVKNCPEGEFQCKNGRCINHIWKCDYVNDCGDGSDEEHCNTPPPCGNSEFDCGNGLCISQLYRCDGESDCSNGKDEENCHLTVCERDQFRCDNGRCVPVAWICDGSVDCQDETDENNCTVANVSCKITEFQCQNGICIDKALVCDHRDDCQDNSDEDHCVYNNTCKEGMFRCDDGLCIYYHQVCDSRRDCENGEDENNCTIPECGRSFLCSTKKKCIPLKWLCDDQDDCGDASDEDLIMCVLRRRNKTTCEDFTCKSGECLHWDDVCNGIPDCLDYSDEGNLCAHSCGKDNGGCAHTCVATPSGPKCFCLSGFKLQSNNKTCEDEDECLEPATCSQYCNNTKGGYKCSCAEGYFLNQDHKKCKAVGGAATLIYLLPDEIRGIELTSGAHKVYISAKWTDLRGMDYDALTETIFWSDWREGTISSFSPGSLEKKIILRELQRPYFLKWDWIGQNIYFTTGQAHIIACNRNGTYCRTVLETNLPLISSLELAPGSGFMFWSVWSAALGRGGPGIIERSNMDGSGRIEIGSQVFWPSSLAVDHVTKLLYWADAKLSSIESSDFNGLNRRTVIRDNLQYPHSIALFEDLIYISEWGTDNILHCSRLTGENCTLLHRGDVETEVMTVMHKVQQPRGVNPCVNRCQQLCFLKPDGYSCACDEKFQANDSLCANLSSSRMSEVCDGYCLNGGTCNFKNGKRYCWCDTPYQGERCDESVNAGYTGTHSWIVAVFFGLFLAAALLLMFLQCRRNKEKLRKLTENLSVSFHKSMLSARKRGQLVMDTDDPVGDDEFVFGEKGAYRASEYENPLFGQPEQTFPDSERPTGEFKRWASYDSKDSAFISEYQAKGSTMNLEQEALIDPSKKEKILKFFRKQ